MDNPARTPTVVINKTPFPFIRFIIPIIFLLVGIAIGLSINRILPSFGKTAPQQTQTNPQKESGYSGSILQITEKDSPISIELLKNPIINQWRGAVEGTMSAKTAASLTISNSKGNSITIPTKVLSKEAPMTKFFDYNSSKSGKSAAIDLKDIPLGSILRGDFFVIPGNSNQIVGSSFTIVKKGTP